jgi:hypothetical protein
MISPTLEQLNALVFADVALAQALMEVTNPSAFEALVIQRAAEFSVVISASEIQAQCNHHARQWLERWL